MRDPGASSERTALAWQRTALSVIVVSGVLAKLQTDESQVLPAVLTLSATALGVAVLIEAWQRDRRRAGARATGAPRGGRMSALLAISVLALTVGEMLAAV